MKSYCIISKLRARSWMCFLPYIASVVTVCAPVASEAGFLLAPTVGQDYVECEGTYINHLQGIATNGTNALYWSFTDKLVKTNRAGKIVQSVDVANHHGDLTFLNGKIYVAVNLGPFNELTGADSWVYEYDANTLSRTATYAVPQLTYGAGGIAYHDGKFLVVGGLVPSQSNNVVHIYSPDFVHAGAHPLPTGYTFRGIQTAEFAHGHWWLGTYHSLNGNSNTRQLFKADQSLNSQSQFSFDAALGIAALADGHFLIGKNRSVSGGYVGRVELAAVNAAGRLEIVPISVPEPGAAALLGAAAVSSLRWRGLAALRGEKNLLRN